MPVPYEGIYFRINFKTKVKALIVLDLYSLMSRNLAQLKGLFNMGPALFDLNIHGRIRPN